MNNYELIVTGISVFVSDFRYWKYLYFWTVVLIFSVLSYDVSVVLRSSFFRCYNLNFPTETFVSTGAFLFPRVCLRFRYFSLVNQVSMLLQWSGFHFQAFSQVTALIQPTLLSNGPIQSIAEFANINYYMVNI